MRSASVFSCGCLVTWRTYFQFAFFSLLLYELGFTSLELFFARYAAEVVGFALVSDFVFGCVFV